MDIDDVENKVVHNKDILLYLNYDNTSNRIYIHQKESLILKRNKDNNTIRHKHFHQVKINEYTVSYASVYVPELSMRDNNISFYLDGDDLVSYSKLTYFVNHHDINISNYIPKIFRELCNYFNEYYGFYFTNNNEELKIYDNTAYQLNIIDF